MSKQFKVAAVQASPVFLDLKGTVEKVIKYIEEAANAGAKIVVFPETFVPGYPTHMWLGAPAWSMQFVGRYFDNSIEAGSDEDKAIAQAARDNNIQVSLGCSERAGGSIYIAQWHYGEDGEIINRRRKLKPTAIERAVFGEGDGSDLSVNDTSIGRVGQLACWEHLQPLSKYAMYSQNEQIHCAAWPCLSLYRGGAYALGDVVNNNASQIYAVEGSCFVIAAGQVMTQEMQDMLCQGDADKAALTPTGGGFARIYAPDGQSIGSNLPEDQEGLVLAEIDLSMIAYAKSAADPAGHYSRPDVTRLMLNSKPQRPVMAFDETSGLAQDIDMPAPLDAVEAAE